MLAAVLEEEVNAFLGRHRYQRLAPPGPGADLGPVAVRAPGPSAQGRYGSRNRAASIYKSPTTALSAWCGNHWGEYEAWRQRPLGEQVGLVLEDRPWGPGRWGEGTAGDGAGLPGERELGRRSGPAGPGTGSAPAGGG